MNMRKSAFAFVAILSILLSACGGGELEEEGRGTINPPACTDRPELCK
ncbi:MAG: hypothetical protein Q8K45_21225 [Rubrivivax sp.]|nr:hypothetical protein [Rubrivivax sp.]